MSESGETVTVSAAVTGARRPWWRRRAVIACAAVLLAWGWYRGDLLWRVRSEARRLAALSGEVVTVEPRVGPVRNFVTGENEIARLRALREAVAGAERGVR